MKIIRWLIFIAGCVLLVAGLRLLYLRSRPPASTESNPMAVKISRSSGRQDRRVGSADNLNGNMKGTETRESDTVSNISGLPSPPSPHSLSIITSKLLMGAVGIDYRQPLKAKGMIGRVAWKISSGKLPPGLEIGVGGIITGIPEETGEWSFTVLVEDEKGRIAQKKFRLLIRPAVPEEEAVTLSILTDSIAEGFLGREYLARIEWEGGEPPYRWAQVGGVLPELIHLNKQAGVLYGTPREVGKFPFTLRLTDGAGIFVDKNFILDIREGTIEIITGALPPASKGKKYSLTFRARGGVVPYRWKMVTGRPPKGLRFDPERGIISGTPEKWETVTFLLRVTGREGRSAEKEFKLAVTAAIQRITDLKIVTDTIPDAVRGQVYSAELTAADGAPPYTWTVSGGELPPSLSLDSDTGVISGVPEQTGKSTFTVLVSDKTGNTAQREFDLTVDYQLVYITTGTLAAAVVGDDYQQSITATGGTPPYTFILESGELPDNLSLDSVTGQILGTVSENYSGLGTREFAFRVKASDQAGRYDIVELKMTVRDTAEPTPFPSPTPRSLLSPTPIPTASPVGFHISTDSLPEGRVGEDYRTTVSALGGITPYIWSFQNLPDGLSWSDTGIVSGVPEMAAIYSVAISVTDASGQVASKTIDLIVTETGVEGISGLIGASGDGKIGLAWTNPGSDDFAKVRVLRKIGSYPANTGDGIVVYEGSGDNIIDGGLTNDREYFYAVIAYNQGGTAGEIGPDNRIGLTPREVTLSGENDPQADEVVSFNPLNPKVQDTDRVLGLPAGGGLYSGSEDVVSLHARIYDGTTPCGGNIIIKFSDNLVADGEGDDFTVFENAFSIKPENQDNPDDLIWMEPAIIAVSQDGKTYHTFEYDYVPHFYEDGRVNCYNPYSYHIGFAGINPVFSNNGTPDPTNPAVSGGDSFDLDDIPGTELTWIQYIKITSTGDGWLTDRNGDTIRHTQDYGACSGSGDSGFDLDAVSAVNY